MQRQAERLLRNASLGPEKLAIARLAFDEAWASVASNYVDPEAIQRARTRIATFVLGAMKQDIPNAHEVRDAAVEMLRRAEEPVPLRGLRR
jgi:hypothetical protein